MAAGILAAEARDRAPLGSGRQTALVVAVDSGASTTLLGFFLVQDGSLRRVSTSFSEVVNAFPDGAGAAATFTVDCVRHGEAVIAVFATGRATAPTETSPIEVSEHPYALRGARLVHLPTREFRLPLRELGKRLPRAFAHCETT